MINPIAYIKGYFAKKAEQQKLQHEEWLTNNPPAPWKVYSTNSYNSPPAKSTIVMARSYSDAINQVLYKDKVEWTIDPTDWNQDWGSLFAKKL